MRALRPYLLLGLLVFAIVALATLPASLLLRFLPERVQMADVSGTIWEGSAARLSLDGVPLGALSWRLSALRLLQAEVGGQITLTRADGRVDGELSLSRHGVLEARALSLNLPLTTLHPDHGESTWDGRISGVVKAARLVNGWPVALEGTFALEHLHAPNARDDLGRFVLTFDPRDSSATALLGRLHDDGGPVEVVAQLRLLPERAYQLDGDVAARGVLSDELSRALAFLGSPGANGKRPLTITGTF